MVNTLGGVFQGFLSPAPHPGTRDFELTYLHEFLLPGVQISHGSRLGYVLSNPSIGHMISHRFPSGIEARTVQSRSEFDLKIVNVRFWKFGIRKLSKWFPCVHKVVPDVFKDSGGIFYTTPGLGTEILDQKLTFQIWRFDIDKLSRWFQGLHQDFWVFTWLS